MAKEVNWIPEETIREVCRKLANEEIDFGPVDKLKDEMDKQGINITIREYH